MFSCCILYLGFIIVWYRWKKRRRLALWRWWRNEESMFLLVSSSNVFQSVQFGNISTQKLSLYPALQILLLGNPPILQQCIRGDWSKLKKYTLAQFGKDIKISPQNCFFSWLVTTLPGENGCDDVNREERIWYKILTISFSTIGKSKVSPQLFTESPKRFGCWSQWACVA